MTYQKNKNMDSAGLAGMVVPVTTPFAADDSIYEVMYVEHLNLLTAQGVGCILVNGTTAEFFSLTDTERRRLLVLARENFSGKIMFHTGGASLAQTQIEAAWGIKHNADAIIAIAPYYLADAPQTGIVDYFNRLAEKIEIPFILYNFPKHTQNPLTAEMLGQIDHFGMKDSSGNLSLINATGHYYVGGDEKIVDAYQKGAYGFVSARANAFAPMFVKLERAIIENDESIETIQAEITKLKNEMTSVNGIAKIKYAIAKQIDGYPTRMRLPLLGPSKDEETVIDRVAKLWG